MSKSEKSNKSKDPSPLVQSVLALDTHFAELERLGGRIGRMELKSELDLEQVRRLMVYFAESGEVVSAKILELANLLNEARTRAEESAGIVAAKAEELKARQKEHELKMDAFRALTGKVNALSENLKVLKKPEGEIFSDEERSALTARLTEFESQLQPLIEEAALLKEDAHQAQLKTLEQNADSLRQSLIAVRKKLSTFSRPSDLNQHA